MSSKIAAITDYITPEIASALCAMGLRSDATGNAPGARFVLVRANGRTWRVWAVST